MRGYTLFYRSAVLIDSNHSDRFENKDGLWISGLRRYTRDRKGVDSNLRDSRVVLLLGHCAAPAFSIVYRYGSKHLVHEYVNLQRTVTSIAT